MAISQSMLLFSAALQPQHCCRLHYRQEPFISVKVVQGALSHVNQTLCLTCGRCQCNDQLLAMAG